MDDRLMDTRDYEVSIESRDMDIQRDRYDVLTQDLKNDYKDNRFEYVLGDAREYDYLDKDYQHDKSPLSEAERVIYEMGGDRELVERAMENREMFIGKADKDFIRDELSSMTDQRY